MKDQELEVKFYVNDLAAIERRLQQMGAHLEAPRVLEINLRFDTPDRQLSQQSKALRLRKDAAIRMTYKGPAQSDGGARLRQEIEFEVSDFDAAWSLFHELGYDVMTVYEKYRTTYRLGEVEVVLDELPYGKFVEIEGEDAAVIRQEASRLGLHWDYGVAASYLVLFEMMRERLGYEFRDLTFENFTGIQVTAQDLQVEPADK